MQCVVQDSILGQRKDISVETGEMQIRSRVNDHVSMLASYI